MSDAVTSDAGTRGHGTPYERIGGESAVMEIVTEFYKRVVADPELSVFFVHTDIERLLSMQREYVTIALGGPGTFAESRLRDAHAGRGVRGRHFVRFLDLFLETMRERGLSAGDLDRILDRMAIASTEVIGESSEDG
jgi:hemoglobin